MALMVMAIQGPAMPVDAGKACPGAAVQSTVRHGDAGRAEHVVAKQRKAMPVKAGAVRRGEAWPFGARHGAAGKASPGTALLVRAMPVDAGMSRRVAAEHCDAQIGKAVKAKARGAGPHPPRPISFSRLALSTVAARKHSRISIG